MTPYAQGLVDIGELILKFAKVKRVTLHEDGVTRESDTDHTVMLSVCACALAERLYKETLDIGKVAQFALVHDLVEVYAGDTNTINIGEEERHNKELKEKKSLEMITHQFGVVYPWIHTQIEEYESLRSKEAQFVKILDKAMSKITNTLNKGAALKELGTTEAEISRHFNNQITKYRTEYGNEFDELLGILEEIMNNMFYELYRK